MIRNSTWLAVSALLICAQSALADWNPGDPYKMHYPQLPDPNGWDISAYTPADDWLCTQSGPVSDIHLWYSWLNDGVGAALSLTVSIWSDVPQQPTGEPSHPGDVLWQRTFSNSEFTTRLWGTGLQGWYEPDADPPIILPQNHFNIYQLNLNITDNPWYQTQGTVYWLMVDAEIVDGFAGWKTSGSTNFMDDAVYGVPVQGGDAVFLQWQELRDPSSGKSLDLAFVITPEPATAALLGVGGLMFLIRRGGMLHRRRR